MKILQNLEPKAVFQYFEEISNIPRGSGNEKGISDYLLNFGKELGLESIQDEALNVISSGWYAETINNPNNQKFAQGLAKEFKQAPGYYSVGAYGAALMLEQALKGVKGQIEDKKSFMAALRNVQVDNDPRGKITLDALGNPIMNVYIRKVERQGGRLTNTVIKTYPGVSQFWTYKTAEFLSNPVYSRDYPVSNYLEK